MQDFKKIELENNGNQKRVRRRKQNMMGYYFLVFVLAAGIVLALSVTLLFNVKEVVVNGVVGSSYNENDIAKVSGIRRGDNLVRMNTGKIKNEILNTLLYVDDVSVRKDFPDKVTIDITPSIDMAYVECQGGYMLVSEGWRIIGLSEKQENENLITVYGFEPKSNEEKTVMDSEDEDKNEALKNLLSEIKKQDIKSIVSIDLSDKFDVVLNYGNRIKIKIEKPNDIEYKLRYANQIITEELRENKSGYLIYRNSLGYSYVSEEEYEKINGSNSVMKPVMTEPPSGEAASAGESPDISEQITETSVSQVTTKSQAEGW